MKIFITIILLIGVLGCATTKTGKVIEATVYSALACGAIGSNSAPRDESSTAHGLLWGGLCGTAAGVISQYVYGDEKELKSLRDKNAEFQQIISDYQMEKGTLGKSDSKSPWYQADLFERPIPEEFKASVIPAKWRLKKVVKPSKGKGGSAITIGKELEIIPAQLKTKN
jgi:hypothetical protein